jgi:hypothetical protein
VHFVAALHPFIDYSQNGRDESIDVTTSHKKAMADEKKNIARVVCRIKRERPAIPFTLTWDH